MGKIQPQPQQTADSIRYVQLTMTMFDLETLEARVRAGLQTFVEVGEALAEIRDRDGFKLRGYATFEDYCETEFGFSVRQGQRLIVAARTAAAVAQITGETPANESVAREIARVAYSPEIVQEVHDELRAEGKTLASAPASDVKRVVTAVVEKRNGESRNGGEASKPAPRPAAKPAPPPPAPDFSPGLDSASDFCPACGEWPEQYTRKADAWYCGACGSRVAIAAIAATEA